MLPVSPYRIDIILSGVSTRTCLLVGKRGRIFISAFFPSAFTCLLPHNGPARSAVGPGNLQGQTDELNSTGLDQRQV